MTLSILFVGQQWLGSNSRGLAQGFRANGHLVDIVDEAAYTPRATSRYTKAIRKLGRRAFESDLNAEVLQRDRILAPDLIVVFKGQGLRRETLEELRNRRRKIFLFFPDVSLFVHGGNIPRAIGLYHHIFTTKSFGLRDLRERFGVTAAEFLPHGFDPDVHRPVTIPTTLRDQIGADASFVGTWSPKKERYLATVARSINGRARLAVWGAQWHRCESAALRPHLRHVGLLGDLYAACILASTINISILSEVRFGASAGDAITSRTFHIPATGGFMLHERTPELGDYFTENRDTACFGCPEELASKVLYYLEHPQEREQIRLQGHVRCTREHSLTQRAEVMLRRYKALREVQAD